MKKLIVGFGGWMLATAVVFAQAPVQLNGYVVTTSGDTLKAEIFMNTKKEIEPFKRVTFQTAPNNKRSLNAKTAKEYVVDEEVYVSRKLNDQQVFLKKLSSGTVNLYEYKSEQYLMNNIRVFTDYYIEREDGQLIELKESKFRKQVSDIMSDNPSLVKDIEQKKYDFNSKVELFDKYNKKDIKNDS